MTRRVSGSMNIRHKINSSRVVVSFCSNVFNCNWARVCMRVSARAYTLIHTYVSLRCPLPKLNKNLLNTFYVNVTWKMFTLSGRKTISVDASCLQNRTASEMFVLRNTRRSLFYQIAKRFTKHSEELPIVVILPHLRSVWTCQNEIRVASFSAKAVLLLNVNSTSSFELAWHEAGRNEWKPRRGRAGRWQRVDRFTDGEH